MRQCLLAVIRKGRAAPHAGGGAIAPMLEPAGARRAFVPHAEVPGFFAGRNQPHIRAVIGGRVIAMTCRSPSPAIVEWKMSGAPGY